MDERLAEIGGRGSLEPILRSVSLPLDNQVDELFVLVAAALVFLMQAGFLCFEVGCVLRQSVNSVAMKNVVDWLGAVIAFSLVGFGLMFGSSLAGVLGFEHFALDGLHTAEISISPYVFVLFQLGFVMTAVTIVSGAIASRSSVIAYAAASFVVALLIYPIFGHWAWGASLHPQQVPWLARLGFVDFAGSTVVHTLGAAVGLAGAWMVGPRLGRFDSQGRPRSMPGDSIPMAALGVLLLALGWWGFNGGSTLALSAGVGPIILNTMLAASAGGLLAFVHVQFAQSEGDVQMGLLGGVLGGMVAITASCHAVSPLAALAIGGVGGWLSSASSAWLLRMKIDDPVGAVPVHGVCGVWGTLAVAIFADSTWLPNERPMQLAVQALGSASCVVWGFGAGAMTFALVRLVFGLRISPADELAERGPQASAESDAAFEEDQIRALMGA